MLDIGWWELFVMGMVALLVVGPKELPTLLRTIGRYVGMIKRQADEFRSQFDDAIRDSEFNDLKNEMESIKSDVSSSVDDAQASIKKELDETDYDWDNEEPIKPAPEFADQEETTSFKTADGEVITKEASKPAPSDDNGRDTAADAPSSSDGPSAANGAENTVPAADNTRSTVTIETERAEPRDAESVR